MSNFDVSTDLKAQVIKVGNDQTPVIVIDNFSHSLQDIIDDACNNQAFCGDENSYYPGIRATLPKDYVVKLLKAVYQGIYKVYNIDRRLALKIKLTYFSLISTPAEQLSMLQRIPHFDTTQPTYFAILQYLNPGEHGGTGFFRHKKTGFESIDDQRIGHYIKTCEDHMNEHGVPQARYHNDSSAQFELYDQIAYKPNRLVIYPGNLLHSTVVNLDKDIDANPKTGRLTSNVFIDFE